ncbi:uncharacterized protein LOC121045827 [Ixodes scapularis]|uniref:uncharacterized protein LOC121045827 n=1 Tax=Ixodes scapularis TaxID=6945 RepID=UPI001AD78377|nr:uncharacterized protein LOC121045827 [Ixodes scapularis]
MTRGKDSSPFSSICYGTFNASSAEVNVKTSESATHRRTVWGCQIESAATLCNEILPEPQTTKMKNASNHGPTGYFSELTVVLGTFPRSTTFLLAFSLAIRILWLLTMVKACVV